MGKICETQILYKSVFLFVNCANFRNHITMRFETLSRTVEFNMNSRSACYSVNKIKFTLTNFIVCGFFCKRGEGIHHSLGQK